MATFLIALFSVVLVLVCLFVTLLVLMQKPSANSGMGAALGGGAAEQAFGGEATNVLTRGTIYSIIAFFILCFGLYLGTLAANTDTGPASEGASISKLAEEEIAAGESGTPDDSELVPSAAANEDNAASESNKVDPEAILEEVKGSAAEAQDQSESATEKAKEESPIQLENLDGSESNSGS
ncbi:preprotein translocase subunit SecG [Puniceicoccus vermicola]|uniref:Protein-export membrane protein SecG n=1 Tax=Puniceicoccus vermicola TaxID=388746 RepID=A0A7X1B112_9BACT|nr:preprotein translocase subunit SecG [Puniceicoccus vermicola]MBC2603587.1 preprotein translocase subunit SecG [Puniceicoccus vermicola]